MANSQKGAPHFGRSKKGNPSHTPVIISGQVHDVSTSIDYVIQFNLPLSIKSINVWKTHIKSMIHAITIITRKVMTLNVK